LRYGQEQLEPGRFDNTFSFLSRRLPPSLLGLGKSTIGDVSNRIMMVLLLVAGSRVDKYRWEVKSWLSDQSTERKMIDVPARAVLPLQPHMRLCQVEADSDELWFPDAIGVMDHLHIMFNCLESAVTSLPWWVAFEELLKAVCVFFSAKDHRDRFVNLCLKPKGVRLSHWVHSKHVDWRWEVLEAVLDDLFMVWKYLAYFNLKLMTSSTKVGNAIYLMVAEAYLLVVKNDVMVSMLGVLICGVHMKAEWVVVLIIPRANAHAWRREGVPTFVRLTR
jgi:hypothetical protein